jgi:hypothetical protein
MDMEDGTRTSRKGKALLFPNHCKQDQPLSKINRFPTVAAFVLCFLPHPVYESAERSFNPLPQVQPLSESIP